MERHPWSDHRRRRRSAEKAVSLDQQRTRTVTRCSKRRSATRVTSADDYYVEIGHAPRFVASRRRPFPCLPKYTAMQVQVAAVERNWAVAAHLSALAVMAGLPFGHVVGPLIVYLVKGHDSEFVGRHARASLNYQITITIAGIVGTIAAAAIFFWLIVNAPPEHSARANVYGIGVVEFFFAVGIAVLLVFLMSIIFIIRGALAASEGRPYTYPFAIRFLTESP
jgi:uncharacterized protein